MSGGQGGGPSVLMMVTAFSLEEGSRGLLRELCDALVEVGARVTVCFIDWTAAHGDVARVVVLANGAEVLVVPPVTVGRFGKFVANAAKWTGSAFFAAREMQRRFGDRQFDLMIGFSPLIVTGALILWAKRHFRCRGYAYLTDFFPYHQRGAGQEMGGRAAFRAGLALETLLLRKFETVACMSPAGVEFLHQNYKLSPSQQTTILRLWGDVSLPERRDPAEVRRAHGLPVDRRIIVFGGQITEGRGIPELLEVAARARSVLPDAVFLIIGKGRLEPMVRDRIAAGLDNVILKPPVAREGYLALVTACDIGVVSTVAGTGVPSFPSKTIDYLRAGIPIVASVEDTTDYSAFVEDNGFGVAVHAGHPDAFLTALADMLADDAERERMSRNGRKALVEHFDVNRAAATILEQALGRQFQPQAHHPA